MTPVRKALGWWAGLAAEVDDWHALCLMTLFILVRYSSFGDQVQAAYACLLAVALLFRRVIDTQGFWFTVLLAVALPVANNWWAPGGHTFLLLYWICAVFLSFSARDPRVMLAVSGRYLIGTSFLFAALWKLISPEFTDGTALRYFMTTMIPIGVTTQLLTGLTQDQLQHNIQVITELLKQSSTVTVPLIKPPHIALTAEVFTRATQVTEVALAAVFLAPLAPRQVVWRDVALIFFFVSAYSVLPVPSFAVLLACIGFASASSSVTRSFFLLAFFLWQVVTLPFGSG
ncbi:hypothetical protein [Deinococcus xianganensis]|uniref:Uncharacterized protein n=1 Tax=Deinococcus xianganensis TaxID=1507289 RepID=A0A6I4YJ32_9DEIO|nr:hypothetical protein [Deinococcus xianganensis]MXV19996.1 hypothetical protein [Deinococcus xianganensis]